MDITLLIITGAIECLIVVFLAGRKARRRITALENENKLLKARVEKLEANRFIQFGNQYTA